MKLFFLKDNSLYKIFKTLEKVPNNKTIHIYIDPEHAFFDNERRGKQLQEIIQSKKLNAFFVTKTDKAKNFFQKIGLQVDHQEKHKLLKALNLMFLFFFNIKKFHLQMYAKKNYIFYAIFGFEVVFLLIVLYILYSLVLPSTVVTITPSNQIENIIYNFRYYNTSDTEYTKTSRYLNIPYTSWFIDYKYEMSISSSNIKHIQNPSKWQIKVINTTDKPYSLIKWTRRETTNWLIYKSDNRFKVPPAQWWVPWEMTISVTAAEQDAWWTLIWARGNIKEWTRMLIKNIKSSYYFKEIYWEAISQFSWWTLVSQWSITNKDISILSWKLVEYIKKQKQNIIWKNFNIEWNLLLNFDNLIDTKIKNITINNQAGEKQSMLHWTVIARINFMYVKTEDLLLWMKKYLEQRPSDKVTLLKIDDESIIFYKYIEEKNGVYVIPTQINIIQWYDFNKDINGVLSSMKTRILGIHKDTAKEIILSYPEIAATKLKVRPPRYSSLPKLKSRIKIDVEWQKLKK